MLFPPALPSPLTQLDLPAAAARHIQLLVKRDDLLRPFGDIHCCGNKVRKLRYNLQAAKQEGLRRLLTFGGAYSNHIAAVATAGHHLGWQTMGIIRGEEHVPLNPTLQHAANCGMILHYVDRSTYRLRHTSPMIAELRQQHGPFYLLPEGGTNPLALPGCAALVSEIELQLDRFPDYICVACGTGGTLAGIVQGCAGRGQVLGVAALRGNFLTHTVSDLLGPDNCHSNWEINNTYHFGGYARFPSALQQFVHDFHDQHDILLDPVYTCKLFYGVLDLLEQGYFEDGSTVVVVHTGGLQGWGEGETGRLRDGRD